MKLNLLISFGTTDTARPKDVIPATVKMPDGTTFAVPMELVFDITAEEAKEKLCRMVDHIYAPSRLPVQ